MRNKKWRSFRRGRLRAGAASTCGGTSAQASWRSSWPGRGGPVRRACTLARAVSANGMAQRQPSKRNWHTHALTLKASTSGNVRCLKRRLYIIADRLVLVSGDVTFALAHVRGELIAAPLAPPSEGG